MACNKKKLYKTQDYIDPEICSILPFRMVSGNSSLAHIVDDLSRKISLMLYSITAPNFIVGLPLLLEILSNKVWNQSYLQTNRLFTWPERQDKNLNIWGTKRAFRMKKAFSIVCKGLSFVKNLPRHESAPLTLQIILCRTEAAITMC